MDSRTGRGCDTRKNCEKCSQPGAKSNSSRTAPQLEYFPAWSILPSRQAHVHDVALASENDAVATNSRRLSVIRVISPKPLVCDLLICKTRHATFYFACWRLNSPGQKAFALLGQIGAKCRIFLFSYISASTLLTSQLIGCRSPRLDIEFRELLRVSWGRA